MLWSLLLRLRAHLSLDMKQPRYLLPTAMFLELSCLLWSSSSSSQRIHLQVARRHLPWRIVLGGSMAMRACHYTLHRYLRNL